MPLTERFLEAVRPLDRNWSMGVELISPLIHSLIRCTRPRTALEVGAGYSSVFILQALSENRTEHREHRDLLRGQVRADAHKGLRRLIKGRHPLPLSLPEYYESLYEPTLVVVDNLSNASTSANLVKDTAQRLGLDGLLRFYDGDFRGMSKDLDPALLPFDLVWFDCGSFPEYRAFIDEYWSLVNPRGGLLLLHSTLTNQAIRPIVDELRQKQSEGGFEMLNLLEPHKYRQNSVTILRRTMPGMEPLYTDVP